MHKFIRTRINRSNITTFEPVAQIVGNGQIVGIGPPSVLSANDVIDLVRETSVCFVKQTIFASPQRAGLD